MSAMQTNTGAFSNKIAGILQTAKPQTSVKPGITADSGKMMTSFLDMVQSKIKSQPPSANSNAKTYGSNSSNSSNASKIDKSGKFDKSDDVNKTDGFSTLDKIDKSITDKAQKSNPDNKTDAKVKEQISGKNSDTSETSKIANQEIEEEIEKSGSGELENILKLFEMFGLPQDITQQMYDYFIPSPHGGGKIINHAEAGKFIENLMLDDRIPQDIKEILTDYALKLQSQESNVTISDLFKIIVGNNQQNNDGANQTALTGNKSYIKAVSDYLTEITGMDNSDEEHGKNGKVSVLSLKSSLAAVSEADSQKNIGGGSQNKISSANANIEEMYNVMKKLTAGLNITNQDTAVKTIKTADAVGSNAQNQFADISNLIAGMQAANSMELYASNSSLTTDETKAILNRDVNNLANALANIRQTSADITKMPNDMLSLLNNLMNGMTVNSASTIQTVQANTNTTGTSVAQTLEELSQIIANNIKNGAGINQADLANKTETGAFELKMTLSPKELGDLLIKVSYNKGEVAVNIMTANKNAELGVLNRIADLKDSLSLRGVNLTDVAVNSGTLDYGGQSNYSNANANQSNHSRNNNAFGRINGANSEQWGQNAFETINKEAARQEIVMSYIKSQRLLHMTI